MSTLTLIERLERLEAYIGFPSTASPENVSTPALTLDEVRDLIVKELALVAPPAAPLSSVVYGVGLSTPLTAPPATLFTAAGQPPVTFGQLSAKAEDQSNAG